MSPILTNHIDIITHSIWYSYIGHFWLFFPRSLKFDKLIWILLSLLPSRSWSSLWWQGQWIVSRLRLMEHGWRGRSCNQASRREEGPHLTLCNQALMGKEALVLGGKPSRQMWARGSVWMQLMRIYIKYFGSLPTMDAWLAVLGIGRIHQIQIHQIQVGQLTQTQLHASWALCCQPNKS